jgi:murein DD-endopeptidase MepM/ murein hydrolase activator NlpD
MKKYMLLGLMCILILVWTLPAEASKLSEYKSQKNSVNGQLDSISKGKKKIKNNIAQTNNEKQTIISQQNQSNEEYQQLQDKISRIEKETQVTDAQLSDAQKDYNKQKVLLEERLRSMYENSQSTYIQILAKSKSFTDLMERSQYISRIAENDKDLLRAFESARKDLQYKKQAKEKEKKRKLIEARNTKEVINKLSISRSNVDDQLQRYNGMLKELEDKEAELIRISKELESKIRSLQSNDKYSGGQMIWPMPSSSTITCDYGWRIHPITRKRSFHTGVDIGASYGASIIAANKGTVIMAQYYGADGNAIIIDHGGGISTLYAHCSKFLVGVGDKVNAGETIAKVGTTGWSTGPHLHFEVRVNGETKNPLSYVRP